MSNNQLTPEQIKLLPPPFNIGDIVEYLGDSERYADSEMKVPLLKRGMRFEITKNHPPVKGIGKIGVDEDGEDVIDYDQNGCSEYTNPKGEGRLIYAEDKDKWKLVNSTHPPKS